MTSNDNTRSIHEPRHDKTSKMRVRPAKTRVSLGICPVWSESLLSTWRKLGSLATHWAHSEDSDQTRRMLRLIWVFVGCTLILLVLSYRGSHNVDSRIKYPRYFFGCKFLVAKRAMKNFSAFYNMWQLLWMLAVTFSIFADLYCGFK